MSAPPARELTLSTQSVGGSRKIGRPEGDISLTVSQDQSCVYAQAARTSVQSPEQGCGDTQPQSRDGRWDVALRAGLPRGL